MSVGIISHTKWLQKELLIYIGVVNHLTDQLESGRSARIKIDFIISRQ
jgi:hypothetical protein